MPGRYENTAPRFDGHPRSLRRFFDEIEILGRECHLSQRDQVAHALRYLSDKEYDISLYPGSEDSAHYTITDLDTFVEASADVPAEEKPNFAPGEG